MEVLYLSDLVIVEVQVDQVRQGDQVLDLGNVVLLDA